MMVVLNVIFLAIVLAIAVVAVWVVWTVPALIVARRKVRAVLWGLPASVIVVACTVAIYGWVMTRPNAVFQQEFGFAPPADTRAIAASSFALGDSGTAFVHFHTSQATIDQIVARGGYVSGVSSRDWSISAPTWFSPASGPTVKRYRHEQGTAVGTQGISFADERRELTFDPSTGNAWYAFRGID